MDVCVFVVYKCPMLCVSWDMQFIQLLRCQVKILNAVQDVM